MKIRAAIRVGMAAAVFLATLLTATPANATTGVLSMNGSGTISPGAWLFGEPQTFTFSGSGVVTSDIVQSVVNCSWSGNDTVGTVSQGSGGFTGSCTDWVGTVVVKGTYTRVLNTIHISVAATGGGLDGNWDGVCQWEPTSLTPATSYTDQCLYTIRPEPTTTLGSILMSGSVNVQPSSMTWSLSGLVTTSRVQGAITCSWTGTFGGSCTDAEGTASISGTAGAPLGGPPGEFMMVGTAYGGGIDGLVGGHCVLTPTTVPISTFFDATCEFNVD